MMIRLLSSELRDRIAAGEVIERVASVVKELVENSMDAEATMIEVEVAQGGHELIRVRDNGVGMTAEELPLVAERHATSKITSLQDLEAIQSWGFRGEALASMAAVSLLTVSSRYRDAERGYCFHAQNPSDIQPVSHLPGTTVEVRHLFHNTPVRRKFLKTPKTEFSHIQGVLESFLLNNFECGFSLTHNSKKLFSMPPALDQESQEARLRLVLGEEFVNQSIYIENSTADLSLSGWVSLPTYNRARPDRQFFYVNQRHVKDKVVSHAIRSAYEDVLFHGRHPVLTLYLDLPPDEVDVNVHPAKSEVRFFESRRIYDFVTQTLKKTFASIAPQQLTASLPPSAVALGGVSRSEPTRVSASTVQEKVAGFDTLHRTLRADGQQRTATAVSGLSTVPTRSPDLQVPLASNLVDEAPPLGFALAQLHQIYILAQSEAGLIVVDMHAAHERVLYEKLKLAYDNASQVQQALLIPDLITVSPAESRTFAHHQESFEQLGFACSVQSENQLAVTAVPALIQKGAAQVFRDLLSEMGTFEVGDSTEPAINHLLATCACRGSVHAQRCLSVSEMNELLRQMEQTPHHYCCNHGRPAWVDLSMKDLDQFFLRGQ